MFLVNLLFKTMIVESFFPTPFVFIARLVVDISPAQEAYLCYKLISVKYIIFTIHVNRHFLSEADVKKYIYYSLDGSHEKTRRLTESIWTDCWPASFTGGIQVRECS